jgi:phosphoribosylformylglycinamidine synthase I
METTNEGTIQIMKPRVCILKTDGTNCDQETSYAFAKAGGAVTIVSLNQLKAGRVHLSSFEILAIPGGFSYGDDIASGKIFAFELYSFLKDQLQEFVSNGNLIIGICNGFQVLIQLGLLPCNTIGTKQATLTDNDSGKFECRWVHMIVEKGPCVFTKDLEGSEIMLQMAHGEGKFVANQILLDNLEQDQLVVLRYSDRAKATQQYPHNPNGSLNAIAGICDITGRIFGLMPHPERYVEHYHYPNWRRQLDIKPHGFSFFKNAILYVQ